jgi:hypothetical protein
MFVDRSFPVSRSIPHFDTDAEYRIAKTKHSVIVIGRPEPELVVGHSGAFFRLGPWEFPHIQFAVLILVMYHGDCVYRIIRKVGEFNHQRISIDRYDLRDPGFFSLEPVFLLRVQRDYKVAAFGTFYIRYSYYNLPGNIIRSLPCLAWIRRSSYLYQNCQDYRDYPLHVDNLD